MAEQYKTFNDLPNGPTNQVGSIPVWNNGAARKLGYSAYFAGLLGLASRASWRTELGIDAAMNFRGVIDASSNPNYPAANKGDVYKISVAGKIGGGSGPNVEAQDTIYASADVAAGNHATVGTSWDIVQANVDGAVIGPSVAVDGTPAVFDGTTGKLIKNITYAALKTLLVLVKGDVGLGNVDNTSDATKNAAAVTLANKTLTAPVIGGLLDLTGTSGGQIKFPATQNPSADANTLDDYEEGTWTASVGGTATYGANTGTYRKIGSFVSIRCDLTITLIGTGSATTVTGNPFTPNGMTPVQVGYFANLAGTWVSVKGYLSTTNLFWTGNSGAAASIGDGISILQNSSRIAFSAHYHV